MKSRMIKIVKNYKVQTFVFGVGVLLLFLTIVVGSILLSNIPRDKDLRWKDLMHTINEIEAKSNRWAFFKIEKYILVDLYSKFFVKYWLKSIRQNSIIDLIRENCISNILRFHSSAGRALPWQGRGRWFKSSWDHKDEKAQT